MEDMNLPGTTPGDYGLNLHRYLEGVWDAQGTTRAAWCRKAGLSDSTVLRWSDNIEPEVRNLRIVADALGISLLKLLIICGYTTEVEMKTKAPTMPERPTVAEAIELDRTIDEREREALRALHEAFTTAKDGHRRTARIRSGSRR